MEHWYRYQYKANVMLVCCAGVWASYDPHLGVVVLDTEGMLGLATNENIRTRLLLKVQYNLVF